MGDSPTRILTIGASCINRFQFGFFQDRHPGVGHRFVKSLFDWNITSLVGTESLLHRAASGELASALQDASQYYVAWDVLLFHRQLPEVCLFHEQEIAKAFDDFGQKETLISKLTHQAAPFLAPEYSGQTHLLWSNIQPNLPDTVETVTPWESFQLTEARYETVTSLGRKLFGAGTTFSFLSHPNDIASALTALPDVHVIDLPRGNTFKGPPDLLESHLSKIVFS